MLFPCFNSVPEKALMEMVDKMYLKKKKKKKCVCGGGKFSRNTQFGHKILNLS